MKLEIHVCLQCGMKNLAPELRRARGHGRWLPVRIGESLKGVLADACPGPVEIQTRDLSEPIYPNPDDHEKRAHVLWGQIDQGARSFVHGSHVVFKAHRDWIAVEIASMTMTDIGKDFPLICQGCQGECQEVLTDQCGVEIGGARKVFPLGTPGLCPRCFETQGLPRMIEAKREG